MSHKKLIVLLSTFLLILSVSSARAQEQQNVIVKAEDCYKRGEYILAAYLYESELQQKTVKKKYLLAQKTAECYMRVNEYQEAEKYYNMAVALPEATNEDFLYYADMLKCNGKYGEAKNVYDVYEKKTGTSLKNKIAGCDSSVEWLKEMNRDVQIFNMKRLNTGMSDWGAMQSDKGILFISDTLRYTVTNPKAKKAIPTEDGRTLHDFNKIYVEDKRSFDLIRGYSPVFDLYKYHVGPIAFSTHYDTAYITVTNLNNALPFTTKLASGKKVTSRRLQLMISNKQNGLWQDAKPFQYNRTDSFSVGQAALSKDGKTLYFVSDMPGGYGKTDIWYCVRENDSTWTVPQNCGPEVNTTEEEAFPTIGLDGALYFSSKGHIGMGGFDLFRSEGEKDKWVNTANMKPPFNSPADDFFFFMKTPGEGFFSSNRPGGKGSDDIYLVRFDLGTVMGK